MFEEQSVDIREHRKIVLEWIFDWYHMRGYTQQDIATKLGITQPEVSKITQRLNFASTRFKMPENLRPGELIVPVYFLDDPTFAVLDRYIIPVNFNNDICNVK